MEIISVDGQNHNIWNEIERSESYLVCCMFDEAASLASSVIRRRLCDCKRSNNLAVEIIELNDMLESAGMVFVQSLKELGRTPEILKELNLLFGSVSAIPVQVFLTGVCFQVQEGPYDVQESLEEFLSMWICVNEKYFVLKSADGNLGDLGGWEHPFAIGVDKYVEVVEVYAVTLLAMLLRDVDHAISWVEKSALPDQKKQELLRKLHSIYSDEVSSSSQVNLSPFKDENSTQRVFIDQNVHSLSSNIFGAQNSSVGENNAKEEIMRFSKQRSPGFWLFRCITLKFGNARLVISSKRILLSCLMFLVYYSLWKKQATLKRTLKRQALYVKKAVLDLWELAFSYKVNPLATVQPLLPASHGSR